MKLKQLVSYNFKNLFRSLTPAIAAMSLVGCDNVISSFVDNATRSERAGKVANGDASLTGQASVSYINLANMAQFNFFGTCADNSAQVNVVIDGTAKNPAGTCQNLTWSINLDLTSLSESSHQVLFRMIALDGTTKETAPLNLLKDITPPNVSGVNFAYNAAAASLTQSPPLSWAAASDAGSGVDYYEVALGSSLGASNLKTWSKVLSGLSYTFSGLSLTNGSNYYPSFRAVDRAGNVSSVINGTNWVVDSTAPVAPSSFLVGAMSISSAKSALLSWAAGSDSGSGLANYQVALGDASGATNVLSWTNVGNVLSAILASLSLTPSKKYFASVRSVDNAGNTSAPVVGDGWWNFKIDKIGPNVTPATVRSFSVNKNFGRVTAISEDESTLVIGYPQDSLDAAGTNFISSAGSVYVFTKVSGAWQLQQKILANAANGRNVSDYFGSAVAISGNTLVVGSPGDDTDENGLNSITDTGAVYVYTRTGSVWNLQQKIVPSGANSRINYRSFGGIVAIDTDTIAASNFNDDYDENGANPISYAGSAYVFTRTAGVWSQQQKLVATGLNARNANDRYGTGLAVAGNIIAVGVPYHTYDATGANSVSNAGAVFVYSRSGTTWTQQQKIVGLGTNGRLANDQFGLSVSINTSILGSTLAIGACGQKYSADGSTMINAGAIYIFSYSASRWNFDQKIVPDLSAGAISGDNFGYQVVLGSDRLITSGIGNSFDASGLNQATTAGAVYYFKKIGGVWTQSQKIVPSGTNARKASDMFGWSLAMRGNTLAAGSNNGYDANGANFFGGSGALFTFEKPGDTLFSQTAKLVESTIPVNVDNYAAMGISFGADLALSEDGQTLAVTNSLPSSLYAPAGISVFIRVAGQWVFQQRFNPSGADGDMFMSFFGNNIAISGDTIVAGDPWQSYDASGGNMSSFTGAAYVFTRSGGVWTQQQKLVASGPNSRATSEYFGRNVAISGDTIVVGSVFNSYDATGGSYAFSAGAAYVFTRSGTTWTQQQKVVPTGVNARNAGDHCTNVAIDGDTFILGCMSHSYDENGANSLASAGAAFVFTRNAGVWTQQQKLVPTGLNNRTANDGFGGTIALQGNIAVIGSSNSYDENGANLIAGAGSAFVFKRVGTTWTQFQKLVATGVNARHANSAFGVSAVALDGATIVIASYGQSYDENGANLLANAGAAFVFKLNSGSTAYIQEAKLVAQGTNARIAGDRFGSAVSVRENSSTGGYDIAVGVNDHNYDSQGNGPISGIGAVFVFH